MYRIVTRYCAGLPSPRIASATVRDRLGFGLGLREARLRGAACAEDRRFLFSLGARDRGLFLAFGARDRGLSLAVGLEHERATIALGGHLFLHRDADVFRRVDVPDFDARHLHAPPMRRFVEDQAAISC
jgi:hypothetical protein